MPPSTRAVFWPTHVTLREVGQRDGLQSIASILPTEHQKEWIRRAHAAGAREIEVGSFVPARLLPQLADTAKLVAFVKSLPGLCVSVLVPNLRGLGIANVMAALQAGETRVDTCLGGTGLPKTLAVARGTEVYQ